MSIFQAIGLALFFVGVYLLTPSKTGNAKKISLKTYILLIISLLANGFVMVAQKYFSALGEGTLTFMDYAKTEYSVATYSFLTFILNATMMLVSAIVLRAKRKAQEKSVAVQVESTSENQEIELPAATQTEAQAALAAAEAAESATVEKQPQTEQKTPKGVLFGLTKTHLICGSLLALAVFVINYLVTELGKTVPSVILFPISSAISIGLSALIGWVMYKEKLTKKNFIGLFVGLLGIIVIGLLTPATVAKWF
jgi:drug/metabolite transporter (DMT)-like permease